LNWITVYKYFWIFFILPNGKTSIPIQSEGEENSVLLF